MNNRLLPWARTRQPELDAVEIVPTDGSDDLRSSRRRMLKTVGVAAVGVAAGSVLADATSASAATTTETGGLAPAVVALGDAPTILVDASLGNTFRVTINGNRTMATPTNPTDGQKIVFEITQGTGGSRTITWSNGYLFSTGLPVPTLSTDAGKTDLVAFIYNASLGKWLLAAYVLGFSSATPALPTGTFRFFSSTNGPSAAAGYSGPFLAGIMFSPTVGGGWLEGYWWWVCASGQSIAPQTFALWQVSGVRGGALVANSSVRSGPLVAGQWNYVSLAAPIPLAPGVSYVGSTGFNDGFPITSNQFGSGQAYGSGIVSGPLTAYSDTSGSKPDPFQMGQGLFGTASSDPTAFMPDNNYQAANFWMDVQVGTAAPQGASYRLWPNYPQPLGVTSSETIGYVVATEFQLSESCALDKIWFFSNTGAGALPSRCAIWNVGTQGVVAGTDNTAPTWSGPAGSGWVSCSYSGTTLPAGDYKVSVYYGGGAPWYTANPGYWSTGAGANGIVNGPLSAPATSAAAAPGQSTYNPTTWAYPATFATAGAGENLWVDVEVTPS